LHARLNPHDLARDESSEVRAENCSRHLTRFRDANVIKSHKFVTITLVVILAYLSREAGNYSWHCDEVSVYRSHGVVYC
jgi:hypothetical protein